MSPEVTKDLSNEDISPFHKQMLEDSKALVAISRRKMSEYYSQWDHNDDIYRSLRTLDKSDRSAKERGEPDKMVVPIAFAQIQTFVAFGFSLFNQRDRFFELEGFTAEDDRSAKVGEALLARDLDKNKFEAKLFQFLLDIARYGIGIIKTHWVTEQQMVRKTVTTPATSFLGVRFGQDKTDEVTEWATSYEGNRLTNISPYRFFPDVRLPLIRFQEGEFCASEDKYTVSQLKQWQKEGVVAGVDFIKPLGRDIVQDRASWRWDDSDFGVSLTQGAGMRGDGQTKKTVIITEVQRTLIPADYKVMEEPLGEEDYPVKYTIWLANDNRVIKAEPMNYLHNEFTYQMTPFLYDNSVLVSGGLSDVMDQLQSVISWFINSRITNVRKVIGDKLVVNPAMVNMTDLQTRSPIIRLSAAATGEIDRHIKQLQLQDITTNHIKDVQTLHDILKMVTGITDSLLGEVRPGKRSATENRNSTSGAAARLKTLMSVIFSNGLEPMGRQMLSNLRDGLDEVTYVKLLGMKAVSTPEFIQVNKADLQGHYDFEVFDGTLPSERYMTAQALEEILTGILANPQSAAILGLDPKKLLFEIMQLRGVRNPERFILNPQDQTQQQLIAQQQAQQQDANSPTSTNSPTTTTGPTTAPGAVTVPPTLPLGGGGPPTNGGPGASPTGPQGALPQSLLPLLASLAGTGGGNGNKRGIPRLPGINV